ncbi:putative GprK-type G-protein coupled receptor protein [Trichoderma novae-zelandiae]
MASVYTLPPSPPNWDGVGIFYLSWCVSWTTLVLAGMLFCWLNRSLPVLKIRGLPLSFSAIAFLHIYWVLAQITYPVGRTLPLVLAYDVQYFFMSLWFPLGVALFHASNLRFLRVAQLQKQFTHPARRVESGCNGGKASWLCRLRNYDYTKRSMLFIGLGMGVQLLLTVGMWVACRKYHPTFGIPGTELRGTTIPEQVVDLGRGWEWWPSVLWQVVWTWIVAPFLIWRAWGIRDTMGWRTQTIGCCISNLHATPMFMIASYVPAFEKVNQYFSPSQWIHLSILMFEILTVFVPVSQVFRFWVQQKKAARLNAEWDTLSTTHTLCPSSSEDWIYSAKSATPKMKAVDLFDEDLGDRFLTMNVLEQVLSEDPGPLQDFSALRDFSGENIAFLTSVSKWKSCWAEKLSSEQKRRVYNAALEIYIDYISPKDAEFPLNLSSSEVKRVQDIFEKAARIVCGESNINPATPFDVEVAPFPSCETDSPFEESNSRATQRANYHGEIPDAFDAAVFDSIESHIKYLVLTNTWPKFVDEMQQSRKRRSTETARTEGTWKSGTTITSRIMHLVHQVIQV